jgi:hypothetical protein
MMRTAAMLWFLSAAMAVNVCGAAEKGPLAHAMMGVRNGCFVETVAFLDHWKEVHGAESWVRVLQWGARDDEDVVVGHAVGVCEVRGALWTWDINFGWTKLAIDPAKREDAAAVAAPVLTKYPKVSARHPIYRFDFAQTPAATPPVAQPQHPNASVRDATIAGARLARHRPVNVVRFDYGATGEERRESAAVVFLFHGRYCVYVPELGTVPFHVRGGVENLRLIQQLLRAAFPGAGGLKKL